MRQLNFAALATLSLIPIWVTALGCGGSSESAAPEEGSNPGDSDTPTVTQPQPTSTTRPEPSPAPQPVPPTSPDEPARAAPTALASCSSLQQSALGTGWIAFDSDGEDFNRDLYRVLPNGTGLERLTTAPSIEKEPAISPDGQHIAFTSDRSGKSQVYLLTLDGGDVQQLTDRPEGADQASFSRDGSRLAFHSGSAVYTVASDGSDERHVASGLDTYNAYFWPSFSVDGSEILFDRNNEIDAINLTTGDLRYVVSNTTTTIKSPSVSPSGTAVAYHVWCDMGGTSIWTTPFSTQTESCKGRRVTPVMSRDAQRPVWGPGQLLAYELVDKDTNVGQIALISRTAGELHCNLTPGPADNRNASWYWAPTLL